ncbi:MAG: phosphoribosylglycinamide formyltransferase [Clostridiales bacterium]|nr:phosphoribosylglycinamide formyltransferase [Clostridiales bacterium]
MLKLAVLVSGGGTNLQAIIDALEKDAFAAIELVISSSNKAYALQRAKNHNIESKVIRRRDFSDDILFDTAIIDALESKCVDLVVLAGYLPLLSHRVVSAFPDRIINVHPSLIPSFCGHGYYGLKVHEAALARGVKITGATVHFVDEGADTGKIIMQKAVDVMPDDTPETLQRRVMTEAEHIILPLAIKYILN